MILPFYERTKDFGDKLFLGSWMSVYNVIDVLRRVNCLFIKVVTFSLGNLRFHICVNMFLTFRDVTEDSFTDLYRVEGLKGIYIASRVDSKAHVNNIGPEHLISLITFDHGVTWSPINPPTEDENGKHNIDINNK